MLIKGVWGASGTDIRSYSLSQNLSSKHSLICSINWVRRVFDSGFLNVSN